MINAGRFPSFIDHLLIVKYIIQTLQAAEQRSIAENQLRRLACFLDLKKTTIHSIYTGFPFLRNRNQIFDKNHPFFRYSIGPFVLIVALFLKELSFNALGAERPFLLFFVPIMLSAWHGGRGPALFTTALAAVAADYFFIPLLHSFGQHDRNTFIQLSVFVLEGMTISMLGVGYSGEQSYLVGGALSDLRASSSNEQN